MGYDKPDLGFVVHFQVPQSVVHYYQQVGRAGRALDNAYGILLSGSEDDDINRYFIDSAFPPEDQVKQILQILEKAENGLSISDLEQSNGKMGSVTNDNYVSWCISKSESWTRLAKTFAGRYFFRNTAE